jgi:cobyrinic acid a,c-diamide synthase
MFGMMSRLLISAAHKSSGKTTIALGLCAALRARGHTVQPFKKGPDYIDPMWLGRAAARPCHNLDFYTMEREEIVAATARYAADSDVTLIEGNKGLYDGLDLDGSNSNAALAKLLRTPVVLVLDARGMTRGIAPLILGFQAFDPEIRIVGVILNRLGGSRHEAKLRAVIEHYTDVAVLGAVHHDGDMEIVERHLGLMPSNEQGDADRQIHRIRDAIVRQVDIDHVLEVGHADALEYDPVLEPSVPAAVDVRIAIARDPAFGFYYPGDLDALRRAGADLLPLNTLADRTLPVVDALFIGGGFPETHMHALEANRTLRREIRDAIAGGLPAYAECGGLMYLARSLQWGNDRCEMVGIIPGDVVMHERPQGRGYVRLRETGSGPWPAAAAGTGMKDLVIAAHEFHYSSLENVSEPLRFAYEVLRGAGIDGRHDGIVINNLLACYTHLRDSRQHHWAARFVNFARSCRNTGLSASV